jgi:hypothetical protein
MMKCSTDSQLENLEGELINLKDELLRREKTLEVLGQYKRVQMNIKFR